MFYLKDYQDTKMRRNLRGKCLFLLNFLRYRLRIFQDEIQRLFKEIVLKTHP